MSENKTTRKVKKIILQVLGVLTVLQVASYLPLWKHYILSNYINRVNANILVGINPQIGNGAGYIMIGFLFALLVVFVVGVIQIMDTARSRKWKKRMRLGYLLMIIFAGISIIYLFAGMYAYPPHHSSAVAKNGELLSAWLLCASYIVLLIYLFYKRQFSTHTMFDIADFALVLGLILSFLGGGILIPGARSIQTLLFGGAQVMPFIFMIYFEFVYIPVLLTRKKHRRHRHKKTA